jgi:hypothetical protein
VLVYVPLGVSGQCLRDLVLSKAFLLFFDAESRFARLAMKELERNKAD